MDPIRQPDAKPEFYQVHQELKSRLDTYHQMKLQTLALVQESDLNQNSEISEDDILKL